MTEISHRDSSWDQSLEMGMISWQSEWLTGLWGHGMFDTRR